MKNRVINPQEINGWGVDASEQNDPTYPMKKHALDEHKGYNWDRPPLQPQSVEVLRSIERPNHSAVFGTATPATGLSGMIRREAFKYSESSFAHWLPLILADRINVVEGLVDDIKQGIIPNIFAERGLGAEWKYNRKAFTKKIILCSVITVGALSLLLMAKKKK